MNHSLTLKVILPSNCSQGCIFCQINLEKLNKNNLSFNFIEFKIVLKKLFLKFGKNLHIVISGNDPLDNIDVYSILQYIQIFGFISVGIQVPGDKLFDKNLQVKLLSLGVSEIYLPFYGNNILHSLIVKKDVNIEEIFNSLSLSGFRIKSHCVLTYLNESFLFENLSFLDDKVLIYPTPKKGIEYSKLVSKLSNLNFDLKIRIGNLKIPCLDIGIHQQQPYEDDIYNGDYLRYDEHGLKHIKQQYPSGCVFTKKCHNCIYKKNGCSGIQETYLDLYGEAEFNAITY